MTEFSYKYIDSLIRENRLRESIDLLRQAAEPLKDPALSSKISKLADTYRYMVNFFLAGHPDPQRESLYLSILADVRSLARRIAVNRRQEADPSSYFAARRMEKAHPDYISDLLYEYRRLETRLGLADEAGQEMLSIRVKKEEILDKIFTKCWILDIADTDSIKVLKETALNPSCSAELLSQIITGILLGCLQYYDSAKLNFLFDIYESIGNEEMEARTLLAIVLVLRRWPAVVRQDAALSARLEVWSDSLVNYMRLRDILMILIRTRDTDRVARKMKEDLIPSLSKTSPEILEKLKEAGELDPAELEGNPEWEKLIKGSGVEEKLRELTEMQSEGLDVMMQAFANLKTYPFFGKASHWFLPFDFRFSGLAKVRNSASEMLINLLSKQGGFCDSDKYSFALSLDMMPKERMESLTSQLDAQMAQFEEMMKEKEEKHSRPVFNEEAEKFARDLYRFFKLYPRRHDYPDVFERPIDFRNIPYMGKLLSEPEVVRLVAEFYFKAGYYNEALPLFETLSEIEHADGHIYEKIGYCYQTEGNHASALSYYEKAELFLDDPEQASLWLLRKMALCNKLLGRFDKAAKYYALASERRQNDMRLLRHLASSQLKAGEIKKALENLYKADYLESGNPDTMRLILNAEMHEGISTGDFSKASAQLVKLTLSGIEDPELEGHLCYLKGEMQNSADAYKRGFAISGKETSKDKSIRIYRNRLEEEMRNLQGEYFDPVSYALLLDTIM